jgi:hypothetical protein
MQVITRSQWGARYPDGFAPAPLPATEVWLHASETVSAGPLAPYEADRATIAALERIGQERFGGGISYSFAVTEAGRVFEGHSIGRRGSHTRGHNTLGRAIVLVGGYMKRTPTQAQVRAVAQLLAHGAVMGWWTRPVLAGGHRDASGAQTACPGDRAYVLIPTINQQAQQIMQGGDDVDDDEHRMLAEGHHELTQRLPNRRAAGGREIVNGGADTLAGYVANADGFLFRMEPVLSSLAIAVNALNRRLDDVIERMESQ